MPELNREQWRALSAALVETVRARVPGWTGGNDSDPGITILELLAFLVEGLDFVEPVHQSGRTWLAGRIIDRLRDECVPETVSVRVGGDPWQPVADVAAAGPDDRVYAFEPATGTVTFGDGVHGRRPADGSSLDVTWRLGGGGAGLVVSGTWPLARAAAEVRLDPGRMRVAISPSRGAVAGVDV